MSWSGQLYLVALLDAYLGPTPVIADFVREQLLSNTQEERIRSAIECRIKRSPANLGLYWRWLAYSGLDFTNKPCAAIVERGLLQHALFDLTTARRVKWSQLNQYSLVQEVRALINFFLVEKNNLLERAELEHLWWDELEPVTTNQKPWGSVELRQNPEFILVMESWLEDGRLLQQWLDNFEAKTDTVNNPKKTESRVFSQMSAEVTMGLAKVRRFESISTNEMTPTLCAFNSGSGR